MDMNSKKFAQASLAVGLSLTGYSVTAQESLKTGSQNLAVPEEGQRLPMTFSTGISHQFSSDIDDAGELDITRFTARVGMPFAINEEFSLVTAVIASPCTPLPRHA